MGTAPVMRKTCRMSRVSVAPVSTVAPGHPLEVLVALERHQLGAGAELDRPDSPRSGGSGSATCSPPARADGTSTCTRLAVSARKTAAWPAELPPPDDDHLLAVAELRLHEGRRRSRRRRPRTAAASGSGSLRYCGAGGDDHGARRHPSTVADLQRRKACGRTPAGGRRRAIITWAPNFCAWVRARPASSCPEMPVGKPR